MVFVWRFLSFFFLSPTKGWLGAGGTLLPIRHHVSDYGRHQRQTKQHLWWPHRLRHRGLPRGVGEEADGEEVLLWPNCWVRTNSKSKPLVQFAREESVCLKFDLKCIPDSKVIFLTPIASHFKSNRFFSPRLLWLYLRARHGRDGHSYCSAKGCERVKVMATTSSKQTCNCTSKAYPKYHKPPSAVVPMPALNTQPCKGCGAKQVRVATFKMMSVDLH